MGDEFGSGQSRVLAGSGTVPLLSAPPRMANSKGCASDGAIRTGNRCRFWGSEGVVAFLVDVVVAVEQRKGTETNGRGGTGGTCNGARRRGNPCQSCVSSSSSVGLIIPRSPVRFWAPPFPCRPASLWRQPAPPITSTRASKWRRCKPLTPSLRRLGLGGRLVHRALVRAGRRPTPPEPRR